MLRGNRGNDTARENGNIGDKVILKKYGKNRRLYDTSAKKYVNLEELASMIRSGKDVQVVDAQTGEDLTRVCLMQIVMDDTKEKPTGLPLELLKQLIVASDHVGREFIMWYLQSAFDTYQKVQNALENGLTEVHSAARSPFQMMKNFIQSTVAPEADDKEAQIDELRKRVAELEAAQTKSKRGPTRRKKAAAR